MDIEKLIKYYMFRIPGTGPYQQSHEWKTDKDSTSPRWLSIWYTGFIPNFGFVCNDQFWIRGSGKLGHNQDLKCKETDNMCSLSYSHKVGLLTGTVIPLFVIHFERCKTASIFCHLHDCRSDQLCSNIYEEHYYDSCDDSCWWPIDGSESECVLLSQDGILNNCSSSPSGRSENSCFCSPKEERLAMTGCEINAAAVLTSFDKEKYCVPCSFLTKYNSSLEQKCPTIYKFQAAPAEIMFYICTLAIPLSVVTMG